MQLDPLNETDNLSINNIQNNNNKNIAKLKTDTFKWGVVKHLTLFCLTGSCWKWASTCIHLIELDRIKNLWKCHKNSNTLEKKISNIQLTTGWQWYTLTWP